ncbi:MAG: hypothetical protein FJ095_06370 [Deltaproteobacteria bacterium]|nr:hypothetical protein [Deltaproteobacteria bacterium]
MAVQRRSTLASRPQLQLATVALGGAALVAAMTGACYEPADTYPNWNFNTVVQSSSSSASSSASSSSASSSSGSGGGGGGGGGVVPSIDCSPESPLDKRTYFIECVLGNPELNQAPAGGLITNCVNGNCHLSGNINFLSPPDEYSSMVGYVSETTGKSFIVKDAGSKSRLITYPRTGGGHSAGEKWKIDDPSDPLYPLYEHTVTWLDREAADIQGEVVLETDLVNPKENPNDTLNPTPEGFVYIPLDVLVGQTGDAKLSGAALTFFAVSYADTLLELTDLKLWPSPGVGIEIKDIGFKVVPSADSKKPTTVNTSLYGDPLRFVSPKFVTVGSGTVLLTNWEKGASLFIQFKSMRSLLADKNGNAYLPCNDVAGFTAAVKKLPYDLYNCDKPNGLMYCGRQCHGGGEYTLEPNKLTTKMDLYGLFTTPSDYDLACAATRTKITPGNVATSPILNLPNPAIAGNPAVPATHAFFKFCGSASAYKSYKDAVSPWICSESGTSLCGVTCVDTKTSAQHCGGCNKACTGGQVCNAGACGCPNNTKSCSGTCVDTTKDSNNCGDCGVVCMAPQTCSGGTCK